MTLREAIANATLKATQISGLEATLVDPRAVYAVNGTVAETATEYPVWSTPLFDESRRWQESSITATVYVSDLDAAVRPQPGWRLKHSGRVFAVIAVLPNSVNDTVIQWRLDVGEVAA